MITLHAVLALLTSTTPEALEGAPPEVEAPEAEAPDGEAPDGEAPDGEAPDGEAPEADPSPPVVAPARTEPVSAAPGPAPAAESAPAPQSPPTPAAAGPARQPHPRRGLTPRSPAEVYESGIKIELGQRGDKWIRIINWHQIWGRYVHTNPGTEVQGRPREHQGDIGLRRSRLLLLGQLTPRFQVLTHVGINNQTFNNARKPQMFVHEATGQIQVWKDYLHVGAGLHYWHGISRMTNASTLNMMSLDAPILNWPTIEQTDQFARNLGVYAKGQVGPVDYRFAFNQPFAPTAEVDEEPTSAAAVYDPRANTKQLAGYVQWQLFERESNALPYAVGTYLGGKKVLNVGAGFSYQPDGTWSRAASGRLLEHDIVLAAADVFADLPLPREQGAITAYGAYYYYDFGPEHLRSIGIMNTGTGGTTLNGPGNAYPVIGTGHHVYAQAGYMLPPRFTGLQRLQPYATVQVSAFDALDQPVVIPEGGLNWLLLGHHTKVTAMYRSRPVIAAEPEGGPTRQTTRRGEVIMQLMVFF